MIPMLLRPGEKLKIVPIFRHLDENPDLAMSLQTILHLEENGLAVPTLTYLLLAKAPKLKKNPIVTSHRRGGRNMIVTILLPEKSKKSLAMISPLQDLPS